MTTHEILEKYKVDLVEINNQMSVATSGEYHRLLQEEKDAKSVIEALEAIKEEPRLKVFQITMLEEQEFVELVSDIIVALGADEESVCKLVWGNLGYDATEQVKDVTYRVEEIEGPFGQGSLLYRHKVIND